MRLTAKDRVCNQALFLRPNGDKYEAWSATFIKQSEVHAVLNKLAAYEDAEEQGLLVRLPCKVGSSVWERDSAGRLYKHTILFAYITDRGILFDTDLGITFDETAIGSEIFLTREEAEAVLKRVEEDVE